VFPSQPVGELPIAVGVAITADGGAKEVFDALITDLLATIRAALESQVVV
jgi:hypothetical protein